MSSHYNVLFATYLKEWRQIGEAVSEWVALPSAATPATAAGDLEVRVDLQPQVRLDVLAERVEHVVAEHAPVEKWGNERLPFAS